jgi:hypothetical protein
MKTYLREWIVSVAGTRDSGAQDLRSFCKKLVSNRRVRWRFTTDESGPAYGRIVSQTKYFLAEPAPNGDAESRDEPKQVRRGITPAYEYPIYVDSVRLGRRTAFLIAVPYVDLHREIWRTTRLIDVGASFAAPAIEEVFRDIKRHSPRSIDEALDSTASLTVLRGARVNFADDPNLRGAVLVGENVMQSRLFKQLSPNIGGGGSVWLAVAVAKIGFWGSLRRRVVIQMDRFGNFRLRPGAGGLRLIHLKDFLRHLDDIGAIRWRIEVPTDRVIELAGDDRS